MRRHALLSFLVALLLLGGSAVRGPSTEETERRNKSIIQAGFDAWSAGTGRPLRPAGARGDLDIVGRSVASETYASREAFMAEVKTYANTYAWFLEMRDGRIVSAFAFFDSVTFNDLWQRVQPASQKQ